LKTVLQLLRDRHVTKPLSGPIRCSKRPAARLANNLDDFRTDCKRVFGGPSASQLLNGRIPVSAPWPNYEGPLGVTNRWPLHALIFVGASAADRNNRLHEHHPVPQAAVLSRATKNDAGQAGDCLLFIAAGFALRRRWRLSPRSSPDRLGGTRASNTDYWRGLPGFICREPQRARDNRFPIPGLSRGPLGETFSPTLIEIQLARNGKARSKY